MKRIIILRTSSKSLWDLNLMAKQSPHHSKVKGSVLASTVATALDKMSKESFKMVEISLLSNENSNLTLFYERLTKIKMRDKLG